MLPKRVLRIIRELEDIKKQKQLNLLKEIEVLEVEELFNHGTFLFVGPIDTPYENFWFRIKFEWSQNYPFKSPKCTILQKMWNPYVEFESGKICIDILGDMFSPTHTIEGIIISVISLLSESKIPENLQGFANPEAAIEMKMNYPYFCEHVRQICQNGAYKHEKIHQKIMRGIPEEHHVQIESSEMKEAIEKELQLKKYGKVEKKLVQQKQQADSSILFHTVEMINGSVKVTCEKKVEAAPMDEEVKKKYFLQVEQHKQKVRKTIDERYAVYNKNQPKQ